MSTAAPHPAAPGDVPRLFEVQRPGWLAPWQLAVLALVAAVLLWPGQTTLPPIDRDESRYAQATIQMLETGDFIDIRLQENPRYLQPVGAYWLQSASVALLSDPADREIWAHRVPSYLAGILATLLTATIGARLFGPSIGFLGGLLFSSTVLLSFSARMATTDAALLSTILVALLALTRAYQGRHDGRPLPWPWVVAFWAAFGAGVLVKGPINPIVVGFTTGALCLLERRIGWVFALRPLIGIFLAAAIALPWYVAIYLETDGAFFQRSAGQNFFGKLFEGEQGHGFPPGYYVLVSTATLVAGNLAAGPCTSHDLAPSAGTGDPVLPRLGRCRFGSCTSWSQPSCRTICCRSIPPCACWRRPGPSSWGAKLGQRHRLVAAAPVSAAPGHLGWCRVDPGRFGPRPWTSCARRRLALDRHRQWPIVGVIAVSGRCPVVAPRAEPVRALYLAPVAAFAAVSLNHGVGIPRIDTIWFNRTVPTVAADLATCPDYQSRRGAVGP